MHAGRLRVVQVCVLALAARVCLGAQADGQRPGRHRDIPCKENTQWTYDLYIPAAYARDGEKRFPILFVSSPTEHHPGTFGLDEWAERNGVIIVGINSTKNGQSWEEIDKIQDAVIASVEGAVRVHHCLRYSTGVSGGGICSVHMAGRHPDAHAGALSIAHPCGPSTLDALPKHVAIAFIWGSKDSFPQKYVESSYEKLKSRGNPVRLHIGDWGHASGPKEVREELLQWMLDLTRLTHPRLTAEEQEAAKAEVARRIAGLSGTADPAARLRDAEMLLSLPERMWARRAAEVYGGWFGARLELAVAEREKAQRHEALCVLSEDMRVMRCRPDDRRKLADALRKLRSERAIWRELQARRLYTQVKAAEEKLPDRPTRTRRMSVANSYAAVARSFPETIYGKKAAEGATRLAAQK